MRGNLGVYLQVSHRKQVRADIKVIKTKFTKVSLAAAAAKQRQRVMSEIHDGNTDSQRDRETERRREAERGEKREEKQRMKRGNKGRLRSTKEGRKEGEMDERKERWINDRKKE